MTNPPMLSPGEHQVLHWMRTLTLQSQEWQLRISRHQRKEGSYLQLEPTPYLKVRITPDAFLAVE